MQCSGQQWIQIYSGGLRENLNLSFLGLLYLKAFYAGNKYYFEIYIEKGSLIKIGVSRGDINFEEVFLFGPFALKFDFKAFSDTLKGWGIYNGELRHNSNSSGAKYGGTFTNGDTIGVAVDMNEVNL